MGALVDPADPESSFLLDKVTEDAPDVTVHAFDARIFVGAELFDRLEVLGGFTLSGSIGDLLPDAPGCCRPDGRCGGSRVRS